MSVRIRSMQASDLARVQVLSAQLGYPVTPEALASRFERLATAPDGALLVVEHGSDVVGWTHVREVHTLESETVGEIIALVVDARARRGGVGRALVDAAVAWAKQRGLSTVRVRSNVVRPEAHAFYPRLGFTLAKTSHVYTRQV